MEEVSTDRHLRTTAGTDYETRKLGTRRRFSRSKLLQNHTVLQQLVLRIGRSTTGKARSQNAEPELKDEARVTKHSADKEKELRVMPTNDYTFVPNLVNEFEIPDKGIASRVLHKDERLNITLFGFSAAQELSTHSAPTPALIHVLDWEADVDLGSDTVQVKPGSFIRMAPLLPHAIRARAPFRMLLVQLKEAPSQK